MKQTKPKTQPKANLKVVKNTGNEKAAETAPLAEKETAAPEIKEPVKPAQVLTAEKVIEATEVDTKLAGLDNQAGTTAVKQAEQVKSLFPEGVFDEAKTAAAEIAIAASTGQPQPVVKPEPKEQGLTYTEAIDFLASFVLALIFKSDEWDAFCMSEPEIAYFNKMERRCGLVLELNSKWFFFIAIAMAYGVKIKSHLRAEKERNKKALETAPNAEKKAA